MSVHARFSPSASDRWLNCPGSLTAIEDAKLENKSSEASAQGSVAHALAEESNPRAAIGAKREHDGFTIEIDEEMVESVEAYNEYCSEIGGWQLTEERVSLDEDVFGTSDKGCIVGTTLHVIDLKYGQGVRVDPKQNSQLSLYAVMMLRHFMHFADETIDRVVLHIFQPRMGNVSHWEVDIPTLRLFEERVRERVRAIKAGELKDVFVAGHWCKSHFCPLRTTCRTYANHLTEGFENLEDPLKLSDAEISNFLQRAPHLVSWLVELKDFATKRSFDGKDVRGWKLVNGKGSRELVADETTVAKLAEKAKKTKDDLYTKPELKSVAQLEKTLGKKNFPPKLTNEDGSEIVIWRKIDGQPTLVPFDDPRPQYRKADVSTEFDVLPDLVTGDSNE